MPKTLEPGQPYAGRREDVAVINCSVDRETASLLRQYAGGKKLGAFVSRLVHEYHGRQLERARVRHELATILGEEIEGKINAG
jgi:hypothetical protein